MIEVQTVRSNEKNVIITNVSIKIQDLVFNESSTFRVELFNGKSMVDIRFITIEGKSYSDWYNDDDYIIDYILDQLGCVRKNGERKIYKEPISEEEFLELEEELNSYKDEINEMKITIEEKLLREKLLKKNVDELTTANNSLNESIGLLENEKRRLTEELETMIEKYNRTNQINEDKRKNYEYLISHVAELSSEVDEYKTKYEEKLFENNVLQNCVNDLSSKIEDVDRMKNNLSETKNKYNNLKEEYKRVNSVREDYFNKIKELENNLEINNSLLETQDSDIEQLDQLRIENENHINNLERQIKNQVEVEELLNKKINSLKEFKSKCEQLEIINSELLSHNIHLQKDINELQENNTVNELISQIKELNEQLTEKESKNTDELLSQIKELNEQLTEKENMVSELNSEITNLKLQIVKLTNELSEKQVENNQLIKEINEMQEDVELYEKETDEQLENLRTQLSEKETIISDLVSLQYKLKLKPETL